MDEQELREAGVSTHGGFPNAAVGSANKQLDLNQLLIKHPAASYFMELDSNEWNELGMFAGDILIVDRAIRPKPNDLVIWHDYGQFMISTRSRVPHDMPVWGTLLWVLHHTRQS